MNETKTARIVSATLLSVGKVTDRGKLTFLHRRPPETEE
jgi:hypothetical protein